MAISLRQISLGDYANQAAMFAGQAAPGAYSAEIGPTSNAYINPMTGQPYTRQDLISQGGGNPNAMMNVPYGQDFLAQWGWTLPILGAAGAALAAPAAGGAAAAGGAGAGATDLAATDLAGTGAGGMAAGGLTGGAGAAGAGAGALGDAGIGLSAPAAGGGTLTAGGVTGAGTGAGAGAGLGGGMTTGAGGGIGSWAIPAAGSVISGALSAQAAKSAAATQAAAADRASQLQAAQFQQTQANLQPYMQAGQMGLGQIQGNLGQFNQPFGLQQFQESPAYQFNLQQGTQALNKAAASRGMYYAPQTLQDITKFSQGLASNEYQNAFQNYQQDLQNRWNRVYGLANLGQASAAGVGNLGAASAAQQGGFLTQGANAQAAGTIGQANAIQNALGQGYDAYIMSQLLQRNQNPIG